MTRDCGRATRKHEPNLINSSLCAWKNHESRITNQAQVNYKLDIPELLASLFSFSPATIFLLHLAKTLNTAAAQLPSAAASRSSPNEAEVVMISSRIFMLLYISLADQQPTDSISTLTAATLTAARRS